MHCCVSLLFQTSVNLILAAYIKVVNTTFEPSRLYLPQPSFPLLLSLSFTPLFRYIPSYTTLKSLKALFTLFLRLAASILSSVTFRFALNATLDTPPSSTL